MRPVLRPSSNLRSFAIAAALALSSGSALAQQAVITGRVTGEQGQPLAAANVYITEMSISVGANDDGTYEIIPAFGLPAINTALLLTSGLTITVAHHALKSGHRGILKVFLALTFVLGFVFLGVQVMEYGHAYHELGLQLGTGIYGSTFFMLTGFHGLHVLVGAIMLTVIWLRCLKGHFTPRQHFAFEAVAWYWHFVDVVWLGLFIFVYWL